jgi:hypothetical protein
MEEMARYLGETDFADECRGLFENGSRYLDEVLFNGEYYEHHIVPPPSEEAIAPKLRLGAGATNLSDPELQLGAGCLTDQLVGQYMAHICGLGYLLKPENVQTTLISIMHHNYRERMASHFNHLRSYAIGDEPGLLVASYPRGNRPERPFPYCNEVWTGLEYTAAAHMLYEGLTDMGLRVVESTRSRYDGRKRSPFDEAECGHHYARAMAAWACVLAQTGFYFDGVTQTMTFAQAQTLPARWFWANGLAWGTVTQTGENDGQIQVRLDVLGGSVTLRHFALAGYGTATWDTEQAVQAGQALDILCPRSKPVR